MATSRYKWSKGLAAIMLFLAMTGFRSIQTAYPVKEELHPFFVSVTELEYNAQSKSLEISCKMFTDDLEKALSRAFRVPVDMYHPKNASLLEQQMGQYLRPLLKIRVDGQQLTLQMVGHEIEEQSTFCYFEVTGLSVAPKKIEIVNQILQEMNSNQINIMHVSVGGNRKSTKLDFPASEAIFQF